jgi:hypothetical protein
MLHSFSDVDRVETDINLKKNVRLCEIVNKMDWEYRCV